MSREDHFEIGVWVDYARGMGSSAQRLEIDRHLASGCAACTETAEFLKKISGAGRQFLEVEPPKEWSRKAEQILQREMLRPIGTLPVQHALPIPFNFSAETVSVRAGAPDRRRITYQTSECTINLRLEEGSNPLALSLVGQITDSGNGAVPFTPIFVLFNNKLVARTSSNTFGEFQIPISRRHNIVLRFPFQGSRIDIVLDDFLGGA